MNPIAGFILLIVSFVAVIILAIIGDIPSWSYFIPAGFALISIFFLLAATILPSRIVTRGMDLIKSQEYNNRLVKVGEPNADRIVNLFNSLIDKLRHERMINREQEGFLKLLIDASPMGVVILDFNKKVTLVNSSFLKICSVAEPTKIIGHNITDISGELFPYILEVPLGKSEIIRKGNFSVYRCYHLNFIQEGFKREFYLLESLTEEIMKAEKTAYEKVIRTISHEVNNSIGGVKAVMGLMAEINEDKEIGKVIESCENRCERMCNFIQDYAEVVKISDPVIRKFDLGEELMMMAPFLRQLIPERISFDCDDLLKGFFIEGDASQIQQVIINIIKNAVESIDNEGTISIKVINDKRNVNLQIINDGKPIDEEVSKQLFTPFFTTKAEGKGIGLTFVREVLNRHNADFSLSTDKDLLTRFSILFHS